MEGKIWPPVWVYGINDHLDIPSELPPGFEPSGLLCADFRKLCATVNAATHPAFRAKLARRVKPGCSRFSTFSTFWGSSHLMSTNQRRVGCPVGCLLFQLFAGKGSHLKPTPTKKGRVAFLWDASFVQLFRGYSQPTDSFLPTAPWASQEGTFQVLAVSARGAQKAQPAG